MSLLDGTIQITRDELLRNGWTCISSNIELPLGAVKETLAVKQAHSQMYSFNCFIVKIELNIETIELNIDTWAIFIPSLGLLQHVDYMHDIDIFIYKNNLY